MADDNTTIRELIDTVAAFSDERDWARFHSPKNLAMGVAIEAGELLEEFQWIDQQQSHDVVNDQEQLARVRDEIADVFCYLLNLAQVLKIDLSDAFYEKMKKNGEKYPAEKYRGRFRL